MESSFDRVDRFIVGTVGMPGEREFFLQITVENRTHSYAMEKGQAIALATRMRELVQEVRRRDPARFRIYLGTPAQDDGPLETPVESEFPLGDMALLWVEERERVIFEGASADPALEAKTEVALTVGQAMEFIRRTEKVVNAGRMPCPFCGLPLNLDGHLCPRANGYRR